MPHHPTHGGSTPVLDISRAAEEPLRFRLVRQIQVLLVLVVATLASAPGAHAQFGNETSPAVERLEQDLLRLVRSTGWGTSGYGVIVVSLDRGDTLFSLNPDRPLAPASNLKLFSTAAALHYLGPEFRYTTYAVTSGTVREGVLDGDLVLFGTGDPAISTRLLLGGAQAALDRLADTLRARGIREIRGAVVGDGSFFDDQWRGRGWNPADFDEWYAVPVDALQAEENMTGSPRRPVADPARSAATLLRSALLRRGVRVTGGVRTVQQPGTTTAAFHRTGASLPAPPVVVLAAHRSPTLAEVARVTNHVSHNLFADALLKTVGRVAQGEGSFEGGERAVRHLLEGNGGEAPLRMHDGSGLSRLDRVSARVTVDLLARMARASVAEAFRASLPEAGDPRGLRRMAGTAAAGNLRAKTGTIRGVSALSGYVRAADGERLAFSIIANGVPSTPQAKRIEDAIGVRLARFARR